MKRRCFLFLTSLVSLMTPTLIQKCYSVAEPIKRYRPSLVLDYESREDIYLKRSMSDTCHFDDLVKQAHVLENGDLSITSTYVDRDGNIHRGVIKIDVIPNWSVEEYEGKRLVKRITKEDYLI